MIETVPEWLVGLPFALSLLLFGMPHGAADGAVGLRWARARPRPVVWLLGLFGGYGVVIALTAIGLVAAPAFGLLLFLLLAAVHFGLSASRLYAWDDAGTGIATGSAVVCLPFALHHEAARSVFTRAAGMLGGAEFPSGFATVAGLVGVTGVVIALGLHGVRVARGSAGVGSAGGLVGGVVVLVVVAVHAVLPPLMSVGVCFLAWHAVPESVRIGRGFGEGPGPVRPMGWPRFWQIFLPMVRTHGASLAFLVPTLAVMGGFAVAAGPPISVTTVAVAAVVAYAVLTPGHFVFQEFLNARP